MEYLTEILWFLSWPLVIFLGLKFSILNINQIERLERLEELESKDK